MKSRIDRTAAPLITLYYVNTRMAIEYSGFDDAAVEPHFGLQ
jgi:hypothetical protein